MAKCRDCKKPIKWIQVSDGNYVKWLAVEKNIRPYSKHECKNKKPDVPKLNRLIDEPWWTK